MGSLLGLVSLVSAGVWAQTPLPVGGEFQINTSTYTFQERPVAARSSEGHYLVVWFSSESPGNDTSSTAIVGQRLDGRGAPVGAEFQINTYTTRNQEEPAVAAVPGGGFVVVWDSYGSAGSDTSDTSIQAQRLDALGGPVGSQFQVNSYTSSLQEDSEVAVAGDGDFVVVWESFGSAGTDTDAFSIQGQRFDQMGNPVGSEFQINSYTPSSQLTPEIAMAPGGSFFVVWSSISGGSADTSGTAILAQRYDANGVTLGSELLVNSYTTGAQNDPRVAVCDDDGFIVVWGSLGGSFGTDDSFSSIQAQRFDATGGLEGGQFQVNTYTSLNQITPTVAADPDGRFVVAWEDYNDPADGDYGAIVAQLFEADGSFVGEQFMVNTYTTLAQNEASVAVQPGFDFLIVWESRGSFGNDTDFTSIQGQLYTSPIFTDGFESGDVSAWSNSQ